MAIKNHLINACICIILLTSYQAASTEASDLLDFYDVIDKTTDYVTNHNEFGIIIFNFTPLTMRRERMSDNNSLLREGKWVHPFEAYIASNTSGFGVSASRTMGINENFNYVIFSFNAGISTPTNELMYLAISWNNPNFGRSTYRLDVGSQNTLKNRLGWNVELTKTAQDSCKQALSDDFACGLFMFGGEESWKLIVTHPPCDDTPPAQNYCSWNHNSELYEGNTRPMIVMVSGKSYKLTTTFKDSPDALEIRLDSLPGYELSIQPRP